MRILTTLMVGLALTVFPLTPALADFSDEDVAEIAGKLQSGEGFSDSFGIDSDNLQILRIGTSQGVHYVVDFKAKVCILWSKIGKSLIPCENLKQGYPQLAKLITW